MKTIPRVCSISRDPRSGRIVARDEHGQAIDSRHCALGDAAFGMLEQQMTQQGWQIGPAKEIER
jgi:hypothetical protein